MLNTNLKRILSDDDFQKTLADNENVMVCCGRMGQMCIPVYHVMEKLEPKYPNVAFRNLEFDGPAGHLINGLSEVRGQNGLPLTLPRKALGGAGSVVGRL
jgi:thioredoxin 1